MSTVQCIVCKAKQEFTKGEFMPAGYPMCNVCTCKCVPAEAGCSDLPWTISIRVNRGTSSVVYATSIPADEVSERRAYSEMHALIKKQTEHHPETRRKQRCSHPGCDEPAGWGCLLCEEPDSSWWCGEHGGDHPCTYPGDKKEGRRHQEKKLTRVKG